MHQIIFELSLIIGNILFTIWGVFFQIEKYRKKSWWFLGFSIICFVSAYFYLFQKLHIEIKNKSILKEYIIIFMGSSIWLKITTGMVLILLFVFLFKKILVKFKSKSNDNAKPLNKPKTNEYFVEYNNLYWCTYEENNKYIVDFTPFCKKHTTKFTSRISDLILAVRVHYCPYCKIEYDSSLINDLHNECKNIIESKRIDSLHKIACKCH